MTWFRDKAGDLDAAEQAASALRSISAPATGGTRASRRASASSPGPELIGTLLKIDKASVNKRSTRLHEAAKLALELDNPQVTLRIWSRSTAKRVACGCATSRPRRECKRRTAAQWALDELITHHVSHGQRGSRRARGHGWDDGSRWVPTRPASCVVARRTCSSSAVSWAAPSTCLRGVLEDERPDDMEALQLVASMCEKEGRVTEALALRLRELSLVEDVERRLQLAPRSFPPDRRPRSAGRTRGVACARTSTTCPVTRHPSKSSPRVLDERGKHGDLVDILTEQAKRLEELDQLERAAQLWARVAQLAEKPLGDRDRKPSLRTCTGRAARIEQRVVGRVRPSCIWRRASRPSRRGGSSSASAPRPIPSACPCCSSWRARASRRTSAKRPSSALSTAFEEAPAQRRGAQAAAQAVPHEQRRQQARGDPHEGGARRSPTTAPMLTYAREAADIYFDATRGAADRAVPVLQQGGGDRARRPRA